jgi:hypothetical protein
MQHQHRQHQQTPPPSSPSSPSKRSILNSPDQHLSSRHHHYRGPSSPLAYVAPIDTFFTSPRQPADQAAYAYQHRRSQRSSIDSTVPSPQDLAREYLRSPGSEHSSTISDPSPIITTPVSTKSPLHQASSAIPKDVVHHEHSHDDQTGDRHEIDSSESGRYPTQGDLKGERHLAFIMSIYLVSLRSKLPAELLVADRQIMCSRLQDLESIPTTPVLSLARVSILSLYHRNKIKRA